MNKINKQKKVKSIIVVKSSMVRFKKELIDNGYTNVFTATFGNNFDYLDEYKLELGKINGNSNLKHLSNKTIYIIRISDFSEYYNNGAYYMIKEINN